MDAIISWRISFHHPFSMTDAFYFLASSANMIDDKYLYAISCNNITFIFFIHIISLDENPIEFDLSFYQRELINLY